MAVPFPTLLCTEKVGGQDPYGAEMLHNFCTLIDLSGQYQAIIIFRVIWSIQKYFVEMV